MPFQYVRSDSLLVLTRIHSSPTIVKLKNNPIISIYHTKYLQLIINQPFVSHTRL